MNFTVQELRFAQKYPFTSTAKGVIADSKLTLDDIPEYVLSRASALVFAAFSEKDYSPKIETSTELLHNEVLAFPVSKILVSLINRLELSRRFVQMFAHSVFKNLEAEKDDAIFDMASDLKMRFDIPDSKDFFAQVSLADYLRPDLEEPEAKLVNQKVDAGMVFLTRQEFARLISIIVAQELRNSLPVDTKSAPQSLKSAAESLDKEFAQSVRRQFSKSDFGAVAPEAFPPCMAKIYGELLNGVNVTHSGRFAIATFLSSVGMSAEKIVDAFRRTPNFSERVTKYQVSRIAGTGKADGKPNYSAPSCDKMRSYKLCVANCPVSHPVQFYGREITKGTGQQIPPHVGSAE